MLRIPGWLRLWSPDEAKIETLDGHRIWILIVVEHGSAECVGWHVTEAVDG